MTRCTVHHVAPAAHSDSLCAIGEGMKADRRRDIQVIDPREPSYYGTGIDAKRKGVTRRMLYPHRAKKSLIRLDNLATLTRL
jgi:hypothetical protein